MSTLSQFAQSGKIKSIQRGVISIPKTSTSSSVIITAVDTTKSILHFLGQDTCAGRTGNVTRSAYISLTNSNTISAIANAVGDNTEDILNVSWQLVEYY